MTGINNGNINWNGNWQVGSQVKALHASTNLNVDSTTTQYSVAWNGDGATVHIGVLVYLNYITTPATGRTITATIQENIATVWTDQTSTTLITNSSTKTASWYYFKYSATETETSGTANYRIKLTSDNTAGTDFRADSASATNIAIICVTQATGTLAAGDVTYIVGTTQAVTGNPTAQTVTVNINLDGTSYGNIWICNSGTLAFSTAASTTTYLEIAGNIDIYDGGALNIGSVATPMPSGSSASLEMNATFADRIIYVRSGGQFIAQGKNFTGNVWRTTTTDAISVTTDRTVQVSANVSTAGWVANDDIIISTTSTTPGQTEEKKISSVGTSPNSITITTDWTNTHLTGAEICNLSRNVQIIGSGSNDVYIDIYSTTSGNIDFDWIRIRDCANPSNPFFQTLNSHHTIYNVDYTVFDTVGMSNIAYAYNSTNIKNFSFTGLCFWPNGSSPNSIISLSFYTISNQNDTNLPTVSFTDCVIAKTTGPAINTTRCAISVDRPLILQDVNIYDFTASSGRSGGVFLGSYFIKANNLKIWCMEEALSVRASDSGMNNNIISGKFYDSILGGDGTNTIANSVADIFVGLTTPNIQFYNSKFLSTTEYSTAVATTGNDTVANKFFVSSHNHNLTQYRYKNWQYYGTLTDNTTTSMTANTGSVCLVMDPTSTTSGQTINWEFFIPVTAATNPQLKFYVKKTSTAATCILNMDIYDSDDDNTLLVNNASITLTDAWAQYSASAISPTDTGYCRVVLKALDGATTGNVGVDDISIVINGTTATDSLDKWADALPLLQFDRGGGGEATNASVVF